jgi:hypothetical protein
MQVSDILQLLATLIEIIVAIVAILIATQKKKNYGWFIALTFALFVVFDLARIFALDISADIHSLILLVACLSMLYAAWLIYGEK